MEKFGNKPASDFNCFRCETKSIERKAEVYVDVDGLLNNDRYPLCLQCAKEWKAEYARILNGGLEDPLYDD